MNGVFINPVEHDVGHLRIADQMVAIVTVFIELMEIHIIQAGTAIKDAVINDKSFKMKNAKRFTGIHRYAIHRDINTRIFWAVRQYQSALVFEAAAPIRPR